MLETWFYCRVEAGVQFTGDLGVGTSKRLFCKSYPDVGRGS